MAQAVNITVDVRDAAKNKGTGTRVARKLRASGRIPAIIYGHKQTPQPVSLAYDDAWQLIKKKVHVAELQVGRGTSELVLIRDIQWDHLGREILHLDFARISADETVETTVPLVYHGTPAGIAEGGVFEVVAHTLHVQCLATAIPDAIRVDVSGLTLGHGIHVRELSLPEGIETSADADMLLAHVVQRGAEPEPEPVAAAEAGSEPEVIGRKPEDEKGDAKEKDKGKGKE
jgi:large subunit ribosomal protein L25